MISTLDLGTLLVFGFTGIAAVTIVACIVLAVSQIVRAPQLSDTARTVWVLIVIVAPFFGSVVWFWVSSRPVGPLRD